MLRELRPGMEQWPDFVTEEESRTPPEPVRTGWETVVFELDDELNAEVPAAGP